MDSTKKKYLVIMLVALVSILIIAAALPKLYDKKPSGGYGVEVTCEDSDLTLNGSEPVTYTISVKNTGKKADTVSLTSEMIDVERGNQDEWYHRLNRTQVTLKEDSSRSISLKVITNVSGQAGSTATVEVGVVSQNDSKVSGSVVTETTIGSELPAVEMAFFYDPECPCSERAMESVIPALESNYTFLNVSHYDVTVGDQENWSLSTDFIDAYNVPQTEANKYPFIFIGDHYFSESDLNYSNVEEAVKEYKGTRVPLWPEWNVTWSTEIAFFYDSTDPYITPSGMSAREIVSSLCCTHIHVNEFDLHDSPYNESLLDEFLKEYRGSVVQCEVAIFVGNDTDHLMDDEISPLKLDMILDRYAGETTSLKGVMVPSEGGDICVVIFYSPTCGECNEARQFLERMEAEYPRLYIKEYSTADPENEALKQTYFEHYNVPEDRRGSLGVFIGNRSFTRNSELRQDFEAEVEEHTSGCPCPDIEKERGVIIDLFESFGVVGIMIAGIIDGVNPCAFATLIFFLSYLLVRKKSRRDILLVGASFTIGVFVTYLLMGIALYHALFYVKGISAVSALLFPVTGTVALLFGFYSLYDYFKVRTEEEEEMLLQLPERVKKLIRRTIRSNFRSHYLVLITFFTGAIISLLEFMCTGQVYLPTIVYIIGVPGYQAKALFYLVLYNLMFIWPLVTIFVTAYYGVSSDRLLSFFKENLGIMKLLMSGLFFMLAMFMFLLAFG